MNPFRRICLSPTMWPAAGSLGLTALLRRQSGTVRRSGMWVSCGTKSGQGAYCAIAGLAYEPELPWLLSQLQPGDTFIDVGANIGIYSIHAARKVGPTGRVFSVEPSSGAAAMLTKNVASNGLSEIVSIVRAAASDKSGRLFLSGNPHQWNSLKLSATPPGGEITATTIDGMLSSANVSIRNVKCIKIDAEGLELEVLQGADAALQKFLPVIVFENTFERTRKETPDWLKSKGYSVYFLTKAGLQKLGKGELSWSQNLIAVPDASWAETKSQATDAAIRPAKKSEEPGFQPADQT